MNSYAFYLYMALVTLITGAFIFISKNKKLQKIDNHNEKPQTKKQQAFLELIIFQVAMFCVLVIQSKNKEPYIKILNILMIMLILSIYKKNKND